MKMGPMCADVSKRGSGASQTTLEEAHSLADEDPGVDGPGLFPLLEDDQENDVEFVNLRKIKGEPRQPLWTVC